MKTNTSKSLFTKLVLVSLLSSPTVLLAQQPVIDQAVNQSVQQLNTTATTGNSYLEKIWNYMNVDFSNKDLAKALINYEAAARMNEYNRNYELLFMPAPGSENAVKAGETVGGANLSGNALKISNNALLGQISTYTAADSITGALGTQKINPPSRADLFEVFKPYIQNGNTSSLTLVNPGQFLFSDNLTASSITPSQTQQLITILTDPFPKAATAVTGGEITGDLSSMTGAAKEAAVNALVQKAVLAVSTSALSDIFARRTPSVNSSGVPASQTVMQVMNDYSKSRFTDSSWYKEVGVASDTALLRELVQMQAYYIWVQHQQFKMQEQQTALLATMNAVMAKMNTAMENLSNQMESAAAQAKQSSDDLNKKLEEGGFLKLIAVMECKMRSICRGLSAVSSQKIDTADKPRQIATRERIFKEQK